MQWSTTAASRSRISSGNPRGSRRPDVDPADARRTIRHLERRVDPEPVRVDVVAGEEPPGVVRHARRERGDEQVGRRGAGVPRVRLVDRQRVPPDLHAVAVPALVVHRHVHRVSPPVVTAPAPSVGRSSARRRRRSTPRMPGPSAPHAAHRDVPSSDERPDRAEGDRADALPRDRGRERGGRERRAPALRGDRDLPHHPVVGHGRARRRVVGPRADEPLGRGADRRRDAERRRRRRRAARRAPGRRARHHVHVIAGPAPDDPRHVQDRRRADAVRDARRGTDGGDARALDLRRSQRRDDRSDDRVRAALLLVGPGDPGHGARRPRRDAPDARPVPALLRRLPHVARGRQDRSDRGVRPPSADRRSPRSGAPIDGRSARIIPSSEDRRRTPTCSSRRARRRTRSMRRSPTSSRRRWTGSPTEPDARTTSSTTSGIPRPSASSC